MSSYLKVDIITDIEFFNIKVDFLKIKSNKQKLLCSPQTNDDKVDA